MDPFTLAIGALSVGLQAFGTQQSTSAAKDYASTTNPLHAAKSQQDIAIAGYEQNISQQNQNFMELQNQRQVLQNVRKAQQAGSMAIATQANQGALFGSAAGGAKGQISGEANVNALGFAQSIQTGRNIFAQNQNITGSRIAQYGIESDINRAESDYKVSQATAAGTMSLGKSLLSGLSLFKNT